MKKLLFLLVCLAAVLPTTRSAPTDASHDEVLMLPEFSVSAKNTSDAYSVTDTISGSRTDTPTKNLPYSISSLTAQFLKDFAIFSLTDELSFISGITGNTDSLTFSVRGYTGGNNALVNGHFRYSSLVAGQVEHVELIKGPSGSIYGQTNPGGTLLVTTFQPRSTPHESLDVGVGSYNLYSSVLHLTGPVPWLTLEHPKLFFEISATNLHRIFDNPGPHRIEKSLSGTLLFKPDDKTTISIGGNYQKLWLPVAGDWAVPYAVHTGPNPYTGANTTFYDGFAYWLRHANYASTVDYVSRETAGLTATVQRRLTDWLSFQAGYDTYHTPAETYNTLGSGGTINASTGLIGASASPSWSTIYGTGWSYSGDLLAHYPIGQTDNQTLFTVDDYLNNRRNYAETPIPGTFTPGVTSFNPLLPITSPYDPKDSAHWTSSTTANNAVQSEGFGLNHQVALFDKRIFLLVGFRHDYVTGYQLNPIAALTAVAYPGAAPGSGRQSFIHDSNDAGHGGVSIAITPKINWYVSLYQGFSPFGTSVPLTTSIPAGASAFVTQQDLKNLSPASTTSEGTESGFKVDFADHRILVSADVFHTIQRNVGVTELSDPNNPSSPTVTVNEGDQNAKGFESDAEFRIGRDLHGFFSYSYVDCKVENQGINVLANGHRPRGTPYDSVSGGFHYTVFNGLSLLASGRYQGNTPALSPTTGLIKNPVTSLNDRTDNRLNLRTPSYAVFTLGAAYRWKNGEWNQQLNVTVKNLFNRLYVAPGNSTAYVGDGRGVYFTYSISR